MAYYITLYKYVHRQSNDDLETVEQEELLEEDEDRHDSESGDDDNREDEDNSEGEDITDENDDDLQEDGVVNGSTNKNEMKNLAENNLGLIEKRDLEIRIFGNGDNSNLETNASKVENVCNLSNETVKVKTEKSKHAEEVNKTNIDQSICNTKLSKVNSSEDIASLWPYFVIVLIVYYFC